MHELTPGLMGERSTVVTEANTARHLGSGSVEVLATPEMIRLMEQAAVAAVDHLLPQGQRTVGVQVDVRHLAATPLGMTVTARAKLLEVDNRRLLFHVTAYDDADKIGEGTHERFIVDLARFAERLAKKRP
ncbi:MAG: thioesterase family protein [Chloroflexota bacterium]